MRRTCGALLVSAVLALGAWHAWAEPPAPRPAPTFDVDVLASDLRAPWAIAFLPDGRALVTEREGRVRVVKDGAMLDAPALVVPDIKSWSKMGLLGVAADPDFAGNRFVYLAECYGGEKENWLRVVRYREDENKLAEPRVLIDRIPAFHNHAGGRLAFGPDGKLYITTGDADRPDATQDLADLRGKILRLNSDGSVPADNPFVGRPDAHPAVYSFGHRNPQGLAFQPGTNLLFETEHGPDGGDEVNIVRRAGNYGWPFVTHDRTAAGAEGPIRQFTPSVGPSDAAFYGSDLFPNLKGDLLVATLRGESVLRVRLDGERVADVERLMFQEHGRLRALAVAPDGSLWLTTSEFDPPEGRRRAGYDRLLRLTPSGATVATVDRPPTRADLPRPVGAKAIYAASCQSCHGDGRGPARHGNVFDDVWALGDGGDRFLREIVARGNVARGMPGFGGLAGVEGTLTAEELRELVAYLRAGPPA